MDLSLPAWLSRHRRALLSVWAVAFVAAAGWALYGLGSDAAPKAASMGGAAAALPQSGLGEPDELSVDSDGDGLADVLENFVHGSDPHAFSTTRNGIPDGWFAEHGYDPTVPGIERELAARPDPATLPAVYQGHWPARYDWTLADAYRAGRPAGYDEAKDGPWRGGLDPRVAVDERIGIPYGWLLHHGLDPKDTGAAQRRLGGDDFTVGDDYEHDTDPLVADTDEDGLSDSDEVRLHGSDARNASTSGTGIPDGWLVRFQFDPTDPTIGSQDPERRGMTILETYEYNLGRFGAERALAGHGLDPRRGSTLGHPMPDSWILRYGYDPLEPDVAGRILRRASDFEAVRDLEGAPPGRPPIPDLALTLGDAYDHGRPPDWAESRQGVWTGGLSPIDPDVDGDGLPDAIELRGWYALRTPQLGPGSPPEVYLARSDPLRNDTDGDGLNDGEEYFGRAAREGTVFRWTPSDPQARDTAFSGMNDAEKALGLPRPNAPPLLLHRIGSDGERVALLDPTRADSDADFLSDGREMEGWSRLARAALDATPYPQVFPGSRHASSIEWFNRLPHVVAGGRTLAPAEVAERLGPGGDADGDGAYQVLDSDSDNDGLLDGWEADPVTLAGTGFPSGGARDPTDMANPDTDADGLDDAWELTHGRYVTSGGDQGRWDLDPSRWSSSGEEASDGDHNLDADAVGWWAFDGAGAHARTFGYTNLLEYRAGTNPRLADENSDGVPEAWPIFWGQQYPALVRSAEASGDLDEVGLLRPSEAILQAQEGRFGNALASLGGAALGELVYYRFVEVIGPPESLLDPQREEAFLPGWPREISVLRNRVVEEDVLFAAIRGQYEFTVADAARLEVNPYLADTDGDEMSDIWEAFSSGCGATSPVVPDAGLDPDADALTNLHEHDTALGADGATTSPCLPDTDGGGLDDATENSIGFSPLNPADDAQAGGDQDTDGDRIVDQDEIFLGTNPALPDSDLDGALDGANVVLFSNRPAELVQIERFRDLGVAHVVSGQRYEFFGESPLNADPTSADTSGDGVPDGWQSYYFGDAVTAMPGQRAAYEKGRPAWWTEARHGVWWWGQAPEIGLWGGDMDRDGLDDAIGEDPVPVASHYNLPPYSAEEILEPALDRRASLERAQAWGECPGNPRACRGAWAAADEDGDGTPDVSDRLAVSVVEVTVSAPLSGGTPVVGKEQPFTVAGRVVGLCGAASCQPLLTPGNRVVGAYLDDPGEPSLLLGAAITGPDGRFTLDACLCRSRAVSLPQDVVLLSRPGGSVAWDTDAASVAVGEGHSLHLRVLATTATFYHEDARNNLHPQWTPLQANGVVHHSTSGHVTRVGPARVASSTQLQLSAPGRVDWDPTGRDLPVTVQLRDAAGGPIAGRSIEVRIVETAESLQVVTNSQGSASGAIPLPSHRLGPVTLRARFAGESGLLESTQSAEAVVALQRPVQLTLEGPDRAEVGSDLRITVTIDSPGLPATQVVPFRIRLGPLSQPVVVTGGGAHEVLLEELSVPPGTYTLRVETDPSDAFAAAEATRPLGVVTGSRLQASTASEAVADSTLRVTGSLRTREGAPVADSPVTVQAGEGASVSVPTSADGSFDAILLLPPTADPGVVTVQVEFAGRDEVGPSSASLLVNVKGAALLTVDAAPAVRGAESRIQGSLLTPAGRPLVGQRINVTVDGALVGYAFTNRAGDYALDYQVPPQAPLGARPVVARYAGSANGTYGPAVATAGLDVRSEVQLALTSVPERLERVGGRVEGVLRTPAGEGLAGLRLHVQAAQLETANATTNRTGHFALPLRPLPEAVAGPFTLKVAFAGNGTLGAANASASMWLQLPVSLHAFGRPDAGRGAVYEVDVQVVDDRGRAVKEGTVRARLAGGQAEAPAKDGTRLSWIVPANAPLGEATLVVSYDGTPSYAPSSHERSVLLKGGVFLNVTGPEGVPRTHEPFTVDVRVVDQNGKPVAGAPVSLRIRDQPMPVIVRTNETGYARAAMVVTDPGPVELVVLFQGTEALASQGAIAFIDVSAPPSASRSPWAAVAGVAAVLLLAGLAASVWVLRRRRNRLQRVAEILKEAGRSVAAGGPWDAAILVAYRRLVDELARYGFHERPDETARELVQALTEQVDVPTDAAVELVRLFELARYGPSRLGPAETRGARQALRAILDAVEDRLDAEAAAPGVAG